MWLTAEKHRRIIRPIIIFALVALAFACRPPGPKLRFDPAQIGPATFQSLAALRATADEADVLAPEFLSAVAHRYATLGGKLAPDSQPFARAYLRNLDGDVSAFAASYRLGGAPMNPGALAQQLSERGGDVRRALRERRQFGSEALRKLRSTDEYVTVLLGATPFDQALISMTSGLPPQVLESVARARIQTEHGAGSAQGALRTFVEPAMPRGMQLGVVIEPSAGEGEEPDVVYLLPDASQPAGVVIDRSGYAATRDRLAQETEEEILADPPLAPPPGGSAFDAVVEQGIRDWGANALLAGNFAASAICPSCEPYVLELLSEGIDGAWDNVIGDSEADGCHSTMTFRDGDQVDVPTCAGWEAECCERSDDTTPDGQCLSTCVTECGYSGTTLEDHGIFLRGVPVFDQHHIDRFGILGCTDPFVGCGAVVGAELLSWYADLGFDELVEDHQTGDEETKWKKLAEELADDYFGSQCIPFSGGQTASSARAVRSGLEDFFDDHGLNANTSYWRVTEAEMDGAFAKIKSEVDAHRPVVMAFCSNEDACEDGIGITDTALSDWSVSHVGLITGYWEEGTREFVHVNMGWGGGSDDTFEWDRGNGKIRLTFIEPTSEVAGHPKCSADAMTDHFHPNLTENGQDLGYTCEPGVGCDGLPVVERIVGETCDVLGGEEELYYEGTTRTTGRCFMIEDYHYPTEEDYVELEIGPLDEELAVP